MDKKCFIIHEQNSENPEQDLKIKIKFLDLKEENEEDEELPGRLRVRFCKKQGDRTAWYELFDKMKELAFEDILLATRPQHEDIALASDEDCEGGNQE